MASTTYEQGLRVKHGQYGLGTIVRSDPNRTSIDFASCGEKKFVTSMVVLEVTDEQPPSKPTKPTKASKASKASKQGEAASKSKRRRQATAKRPKAAVAKEA